jgi:hypothetical protein
VAESNGIDFDTFISIEDKNLRKNIEEFKKEVELFKQLDRIFQRPIPRLNQSGSTEILIKLYYFVHCYLFSSIITLFRTHLSESLSSLRVAIDAGLAAYEIIRNPESVEKYYEQDGRFKFIKRVIEERANANDPEYGFAKPLIIMHGFCSMVGSHADYSSFFYRVDELKDSSPKDGYSRFWYFQHPDSRDEYCFYINLYLLSFFQIFQIFLIFLNDTFEIIDEEWDNQIASFEKEIKTKYLEYSRKFRSDLAPDVLSSFD